MRRVSLTYLLAASICAELTLGGRQALAGPATASLTATDATNVKCPTSISVTGGATGTPGTTYSFQFDSHFNGKTATVFAPGTFVMPASGNVSKTFSIAIPSLTASGNYIELLVATPGVALPATANLAVTCASQGGDLGTPTGLTSTTDKSACASHMTDGSQIALCESAVQKRLVMTWNYDQNACSDKPCARPEGFNVLASVHHAPYAVVQVEDRGPEETASVLDESHDAAAGTCFEIQAHRGTGDLGPLGAPFCVVPDPVVIQGSGFMDAHADLHFKGTVGPGLGFSFSCPASGGNPLGQTLLTTGGPYHQFDVGYIMQDNTCSRTDSVHQGVVQFDLTHLLPYKIRTASFGMHVTSATENAGGGIGSNGSERATGKSCAASIGTPVGWKVGDPLPATVSFDKVASLPSAGSDGWVRVDVTDLARKWIAASGSNHGLVVSANAPTAVLGSDFGNFDLECLTSYDGVNLTITYESGT